jgi:hypothetical protein
MTHNWWLATQSDDDEIIMMGDDAMETTEMSMEAERAADNFLALLDMVAEDAGIGELAYLYSRPGEVLAQYGNIDGQASAG